MHFDHVFWGDPNQWCEFLISWPLIRAGCSTILFAVLSTGRQWHKVKALHELRPEASALQQRGPKPDRHHKHADNVIPLGSHLHRFVTLPP